MAQREVHVPRDQGTQRGPRVRGAGRALPADPQQLLADVHEHLGQHRVLGGEVLVQRRAGDPARRTELVDGDPVEPALREQARGGRQDLLAPGAGHRPTVAQRVNVR
jgi:hypothetical protein